MKKAPSKTTKQKSSLWVVLKFGGTSVSSLKCWKTIASLIIERQKEGLRPLVVCSALSGVSDDLNRLIAGALKGRQKTVLNEIKEKHGKLARELGVKIDKIDNYFKELSKLATGIAFTREETPRLHAKILSCGELMLTHLAFEFLKKEGIDVAWVDAREHLISFGVQALTEQRRFLSAVCQYDTDKKLQDALAREKKPVILTQGFIACDTDGETVLLGRGGSDVSAAYFAAKLGASRLEIWTDVPGIYTASPTHVPTARLLKTLGYDEAQEIASSGAKVLHPRCIAPAKRYGIPIQIGCTPHPEINGTVISAADKDEGAQVKAISARIGITLISMDTVDMWQQAGFLADVFACFKRHGISIDLVSTSETNVTVTLDRQANVADTTAIDALIRELSEFCHARAIGSCALVSLVGKNIRAILHYLAPALEVFEEQRIHLISQAANDLNLAFVVDEEQAWRLVQKLHGELFPLSVAGSHLGASWQEVFVKPGEAGTKGRDRWWRRKKDELIALARRESPLYVYDEETIDASISKLKGISGVDRIFYSLKANPHPKVLARCHDAGLSFECVSPGEIKHLFEFFPDIDAKQILFTPNFAPRVEYEYAFEKGVIVTLDNLYPLEAWPDVFKGKGVFVRIDPGEGQGHHKYVRTAGAKSKFGIWPSEIDKLEKLLKKCGARVVGLHAHVGSNIFVTDTWSKTALFLASIAKRFPDVRALDVGGGLGVVERPGQVALDLNAVGENMVGAASVPRSPAASQHGAPHRTVQGGGCSYKKYEIWIEPGRFIVSEAGVLLARVTQTKQKGEYSYVGVNAGMNALIRPALYGAYHEIVNLTRIDEEPTTVANIVGPICESGDILGFSRQIAPSKDGDVILIATAGAYGRVMSSNYNMREFVKERFL